MFASYKRLLSGLLLAISAGLLPPVGCISVVSDATNVIINIYNLIKTGLMDKNKTNLIKGVWNMGD